MSSSIVNVLIVLALIMIEAVFVAAEIALVSLREGQVEAMAEAGRRGQAVSRLVSDPNRFLATVQIGVTSTALLSSAFGAVTLSEQAKDFLVDRGLGTGLASVIGIVGVTLVISVVTLVFGELAPKRLALQRPDRIASILGPTLDRLATIFRPVIWFLSRATDLTVRVLGGDPNAGREPISEEELRGLVAAHEALDTDERRLIDDVFAAGDKSISEVMLPRPEVAFLEASLSVPRAIRKVSEAPHSRYPVIGRNSDDVVGFVHVRDLLLNDGSWAQAPDQAGEPGRPDRTKKVADYVREVKWLPGSKKVLAALSEMRREGFHLAIVADEYGGTDGIVTLEDLIEEVIGDIRDEYDVTETGSRRRPGGEVELDARTNLDDFAEATGVVLPEGPYETAGGFVMARIGRLPVVGDVALTEGARLTVQEVDGRRVARLRVTPVTQPPTSAADGPIAPAARRPSG